MNYSEQDMEYTAADIAAAVRAAAIDKDDNWRAEWHALWNIYNRVVKRAAYRAAQRKRIRARKRR